MSTATGNGSGEDQLVDAMVAFCSDIFASCFIFDLDVQREVAKNLLASGKFIDFTGHKYNMLAEATQQFSHEGKSSDPFDMQRQVIHVRAGLTPAEKTGLAAANQDVELRFADVTLMPHGLQYGQRIIDTQRCIALIDHKTGVVLDIGGNYAMHASSGRNVTFHCCTKLEGELEWHRQVNRSVNLYYADVERADYCTNGTENCMVQSPNGICIHTMPNIDPDFWPQIFRNHSLEVVVSIFHYDVALETDAVGFITEANMHWHIKEDGYVHFYFENDSSHGYDHRHDWLVKYGSNWMATLPDWDYVVYYQVDFIEAGRAQATLTRLEKSTLGVQEVTPLYRYVDTEDMVELLVPKFDEKLGFSIRDPRAYALTPVKAPMAVLAYLYKYGIANDKSDPGRPITADEMREHAHAFNHVRKVNGTNITIPNKQSHEVIDDVAIGAYLLVVKRVAMNRVIYGAYTDHMLSLQRRWGEESVFSLAAKSFSYAAISPFILMAGSMKDVIDLVAVHMRNTIGASKVLASMQEVLPYRRLSPMRPVNAMASSDLSLHTGAIIDPVEINPEIDPAEFYKVFKDTMPPETRSRMEEFLGEEAVEESVLPDPDQPLPHQHAYTELPYPENRREWIEAYGAFEDDLDTRTLPPRVTALTTIEERISDSKVWDFYGERVFEYALSMVDEGLHVVSNAAELCRATWTGTTPNRAEIDAKNNQEDLGVAYHRIVNGVVSDMDMMEPHAIVMDPADCMVYEVVRRGGECRVFGTKSDYVFVCESFRIFNNFKLGKIAHKNAVTMGEPKPIPAVLNNGVPGCGKTWMIMQGFTLRDVILVAVRSTRNAIYAALCKDPRFAGHEKTLEKRVRTADSGNLNGLPIAKTLFIDEGLMLHSGALTLALKLSAASKLYVFGDTEQIGYIGRGTPLGNLHFESLFYWTQVIESNISARMPVDACYVSAQLYPEERRKNIRTYNPVMRSIVVEYVPDIKSPAYTEPQVPYVYISFLRADRGKLVNYPGFVDGKKRMPNPEDPVRPVMSVHEVQGETFPFVCLFRMNVHNAKTFASKPHINVSFSRHTMRLVIRSPCEARDDEVVKLAQQVALVDDQELRGYMEPAPEWVMERHMVQEKRFAQYLRG